MDPQPNASSLNMPAPESCKCVEINSQRYDSLLPQVQRLQTELKTLQDQVMAPLQ